LPQQFDTGGFGRAGSGWGVEPVAMLLTREENDWLPVMIFSSLLKSPSAEKTRVLS
jgi:hypothetical protein